MFGYENMNGYIKKEFHGSRKVLDPLVFNVQMRQSLPIVHNLLCKTESPQTTILLKKLSGEQKHPNMTSVGPNAYFVGRLKNTSLHITEKKSNRRVYRRVTDIRYSNDSQQNDVKSCDVSL